VTHQAAAAFVAAVAAFVAQWMTYKD